MCAKVYADKKEFVHACSGVQKEGKEDSQMAAGVFVCSSFE